MNKFVFNFNAPINFNLMTGGPDASADDFAQALKALHTDPIQDEYPLDEEFDDDELDDEEEFDDDELDDDELDDDELDDEDFGEDEDGCSPDLFEAAHAFGEWTKGLLMTLVDTTAEYIDSTL